MPETRKIRSVEWTANSGQGTKAAVLGKLTIYYSNGTVQEFEDIERGEYFKWQQIGYDWRKPPYGVTPNSPRVRKNHYDVLQDQIDAIDAEAEIKRERRKRMFKTADDQLRVKLGEAEYKRRFPGKW